MRIALRVAIGVLIAALVAVAMIPIVVIRDLNSGGTGWGLCEGGLESCTNSYFVGLELIALLALALLLVLIMLRLATRSLRFIEHQYDRSRVAETVAPPRAGADSIDAAGSPARPEVGQTGPVSPRAPRP